MDHPTATTQSSTSSIIHNLTKKPSRLRLHGPKFRFFGSRTASNDAPRPEHSKGKKLSLDLGDTTWLEHIQQTGLLSSSVFASPKHQKSRSDSAPQISSDFSRLALTESSARPSLESLQSTAAVSPTESTSTASTMRRQAKRSIFRIGQVEKPFPSRRAAADAAGKTRSIDLIAGQYQALLESRDAVEYEALLGLSDPDVVSPHIVQPTVEDDPIAPLYPEDRAIKRPKPTRLPTQGEPGFVAFEEDVIYFKPISFAPEPSPRTLQPVTYQSSKSPSPEDSPAHSSRTHQASQDMLAKEMTTALTTGMGMGMDQTRSIDPTHQIGVMIQTYKHLRDQVAEKDLRDPEAQNVRWAFDSWLAALSTVQENFSNDATATRI